MITRELCLNLMPSYSFEEEYDICKIAFFDIETTGLSAQSSYVYLIGCAYFRDGSFHLIQWFCEGINEEGLLIKSFFDFLKNFRLLIHFNGSGFDIPFIEEKIRLLGLDCGFGSIESLDIYKLIKPYRSILNIKNLRLKSLESFLQIRRKDTLDGEDLIGVYAAYIGKKRYESLRQSRNPDYKPEMLESALLLEQLLQHNEDDIRGLMQISSVLNYPALFERPVRIMNAKTEGDRFIIDFEIPVRLPMPVSFGDDLAFVSASESIATLSVLVYEGELKHFYENYRDYYYLPAEDCAIHKSVAVFVDKKYRIKAKPGNCYTRKQGLFAPQYDKWLSPYFMQNYQDKLTFVEIHTDSLLQEERLELYVRHMLRHMLVSAQRAH